MSFAAIGCIPSRSRAPAVSRRATIATPDALRQATPRTPHPKPQLTAAAATPASRNGSATGAAHGPSHGEQKQQQQQEEQQQRRHPQQQEQQQQQGHKLPPPYTRLSMPVYSLGSVGHDGGSPTLNLVTYAAPICLQPRHYALGLYRGTLSWSNMLATRRGVLQILGEHHVPLFELLGRTSGRQVDKLAELAARGVPVERRQSDGIPVLADSLGWVELCFASEPMTHGDHDVVICEVTAWHTPGGAAEEGPQVDDSSQQQQLRPLYTDHLKQLGLI